MATMHAAHRPGQRQQATHRPDFCAARARRFILIAAILASALGFIDGSVVAIALPAMRDGLGATLAEAQWIQNAYMLSLSALILVGGALGDRFGLSRVFGLGIAIFVASSLVCAVAPDPELLIWARAVQGAGAALMVPGSLAMISRAYPAAERGRAIGLWAASSALTTAAGPILGGVLLTYGGEGAWRWIFAINLPLGAAALWLVIRNVERDAGQPGRAVDWPGAALATAGLALIALALTGAEGHGEGPERAPLIGAAGAAVLALFLWREARTDHPMLPLRLFANRTFSAANLATFCLYFALSAILFFLPMTVVSTWGVTELEMSAAFAPLSVFIFLFSSRAGDMATRVGAGRMIGIGAAMVALAYALLALLAPLQAFWMTVLPAMCVMGAGMSMVVAPLSTAVMGAVGDDDTGVASGVNNAVSRTAGLIAVAAMGGVAAFAYAAAGGPASFGATGTEPAHLDATTSGFVLVAWVTAALAAAAAVLAWLGIDRTEAAA